MKLFIAMGALFIVGCGGVDVGGIPIDVGGLNFNGDLNIGDINLGDRLGSELLDAIIGSTDSATEAESDADTIEAEPHPADTNGDFIIDSEEVLAYGVAFQNDELDDGQDKNWLDVAVSIWQARADGAYFDDMESDKPLNWKSIIIDEDAKQQEAHPADTNGDFLLTGEEILTYASAFQNDELGDGQDKSWLDVAVSIWQARADGAYFDDMESDKPLNWKSMNDTTVVSDGSGDVMDGDVMDGDVMDDGSGDVMDVDEEPAGKGYDILFKVTPLSPVTFSLTVVDPTDKYNSNRSQQEGLGWLEGAAWDGFYRVQVSAGNNYNGVNEQVLFSISIYKDGELVLKEEHSIAESGQWDNLSIAYP